MPTVQSVRCYRHKLTQNHINVANFGIILDAGFEVIMGFIILISCNENHLGATLDFFDEAKLGLNEICLEKEAQFVFCQRTLKL